MQGASTVKRYPRLPLWPLMFVLLLPGPALATHEADHRYNVKGFVLDENEAPVANSTVTVRSGNEVIGYQTTNSRGYYNIQLHLHDSDLGKRLRLQTGAGEATIQVTFTPGDKTSRRIHHANIIGGQLVETRLWRRSIPTWTYVTTIVGIVVVTTAIVFARRLQRLRKRRLRQAQKQTRKRR